MTDAYQELVAYSPIHDCPVGRISMTDNNCQEFFMLIPDRGRRGEYRAARAAALDAIAEAINSGCEPGEVLVDPVAWNLMLAEHQEKAL